MYNLLEEKWISVRCASGEIRWIAPYEIVALPDPPIAICSVRPDFEGAMAQFVIGLLQTACSPEDKTTWRAWNDHPPSPEELKEHFAWMKPAFFLNGNGPRFMQDQGLSSLSSSIREQTPIGALLLDTPGEQTIKLNKDLFIKRDQIHALSFPATAAALLTLQLNAPSGGQGHRTSLRGGGPLTTLILGKTLWETLWLNVLPKSSFLKGRQEAQDAEIEDIFPWMKPLQTSAHDEMITPMDMHPAQYFWATPRRIFLTIPDHQQGNCNLLKTQNTPVVLSYVTKNYGPNYKGAFEHPLTPSFRLLNSLSYEFWPYLGLHQTKEENRRPAPVIAEFDKLSSHQSFRLWLFGYEMGQAKAQSYFSKVWPLFPLLSSKEEQERFVMLSMGCAEASTQVRKRTLQCIKEALWTNPKQAEGYIFFLSQEFWEKTEFSFFETIQKLHKHSGNKEETKVIFDSWLKILQQVAIQMFERHSQVNADFQFTNIARVAKAYNQLRAWVAPSGKTLRALIQA